MCEIFNPEEKEYIELCASQQRQQDDARAKSIIAEFQKLPIYKQIEAFKEIVTVMM